MQFPLKQTSHYDLFGKYAEQKGEQLFGIKGTTPLSKIINLPQQVPYDYMHLVYVHWSLKLNINLCIYLFI